MKNGFVYLREIDPTIIQDLKYYTGDNFIGRRIKGYVDPECILTLEAACALAAIQRELARQSLCLKVFDAYRPQIAVDDFIDWCEDINDQKMKSEFYPNVDKQDFFKLGYLVRKSSHSRGSTVDLTIARINAENNEPQELDMGTRFDFMDELSHPLTKRVQGAAKHYRILLRQIMRQGGFRPYNKEWWHFTLKHEPYPDTYFNFPVSSSFY